MKKSGSGWVHRGVSVRRIRVMHISIMSHLYEASMFDGERREDFYESTLTRMTMKINRHIEMGYLPLNPITRAAGGVS